MILTSKETGNFTIVNIEGNIILEETEAIKTFIEPLIESPDIKGIIINGSKVDYIDSQTDIKNFRKVFSGEPIRSIKKVNWILVAPKNKQPDKKALITLFDLLQPVFIEKIEAHSICLNPIKILHPPDTGTVLARLQVFCL